MAKLKQRSEHGVGEDQQESYDSIKVGSMLYGYCCGYFGRDSYGDKRVIAKSSNQLVVVDENGVHDTSYKITDWNELVRSSNDWLENRE